MLGRSGSGVVWRSAALVSLGGSGSGGAWQPSGALPRVLSPPCSSLSLNANRSRRGSCTRAQYPPPATPSSGATVRPSRLLPGIALLLLRPPCMYACRRAKGARALLLCSNTEPCCQPLASPCLHAATRRQVQPAGFRQRRGPAGPHRAAAAQGQHRGAGLRRAAHAGAGARRARAVLGRQPGASGEVESWGRG